MLQQTSHRLTYSNQHRNMW